MECRHLLVLGRDEVFQVDEAFIDVLLRLVPDEGVPVDFEKEISSFAVGEFAVVEEEEEEQLSGQNFLVLLVDVECQLRINRWRDEAVLSGWGCLRGPHKS